jgi:hypothetical protein
VFLISWSYFGLRAEINKFIDAATMGKVSPKHHSPSHEAQQAKNSAPKPMVGGLLSPPRTVAAAPGTTSAPSTPKSAPATPMGRAVDGVAKKNFVLDTAHLHSALRTVWWFTVTVVPLASIACGLHMNAAIGIFRNSGARNPPPVVTQRSFFPRRELASAHPPPFLACLAQGPPSHSSYAFSTGLVHLAGNLIFGVVAWYAAPRAVVKRPGANAVSRIAPTGLAVGAAGSVVVKAAAAGGGGGNRAVAGLASPQGSVVRQAP